MSQIEAALAELLQKRGYSATAHAPGQSSRVGYVLAMYDDRRLVIRVRRYGEKTDPEYLAAFERAMVTGKIGAYYVLTFDGTRGATHGYTLHVASHSGDIAQLVAAIMARIRNTAQ